MLHNIERVTKQTIESIQLPSFAVIEAKAQDRLMARFKAGLAETPHPKAAQLLSSWLREIAIAILPCLWPAYCSRVMAGLSPRKSQSDRLVTLILTLLAAGSRDRFAARTAKSARCR